jgi:hypothetical protein
MLAPNKISPREVPTSRSSGKAEVKYLSSWKEIANYMGKGVRTVQRYEAEFGLPVRRPAGKSRAAVVATRSDIDAWVEASSNRAALQRSVSSILTRDPELNEIREGIREMHELRRQMHGLRAETNTSLKLLIAGVQVLVKSTREQRRHSDEALEAAMRPTRNSAERLFGTDPRSRDN